LWLLKFPADGGEEFVIMLADSELTQTEARFICDLRFTLSCGLAEFSFNETAEDLLR
jgi:hypothetical protein